MREYMIEVLAAHINHEWSHMADFLRRHPGETADLCVSEGYCKDCHLAYDRLIKYGKA